ncbi:MAG: co-chaperone protein HscB [Bacteroidota bacterium]|jgi:DnaJ-domain-containing protein 1
MSNPFAFFGLTPSLNIDEKALRKSYLDIQRGAHPDLAMADQHEIEISELANAHYQVLMNPQTRVRTYLNVLGTVNWNDNQLPGNFLMEMMDLSDAIEEMDRSDVESMNEVESQLETYFTALNQELIEFQHQPAPDIPMLGLWYQKSQYLNRLRKNFDGITEI